MGKPNTAVLAVLVAALAATASAQTRPQAAPGTEEGFFRPSRDPALTSIRPPPAPSESRPDARAQAAPVTAVVVDMADEVREAEEEAMERVEAEQRAAIAQERAKAPVITSPLDGTAPIMSPLDGSAPIVSPVGR